MILKLRASLEYPTFPVNQCVFQDFGQDQEMALAAPDSNGGSKPETQSAEVLTSIKFPQSLMGKEGALKRVFGNGEDAGIEVRMFLMWWSLNHLYGGRRRASEVEIPNDEQFIGYRKNHFRTNSSRLPEI